MEALVQEKILSQFVNTLTPQTSIVQPINVNINDINISKMIFFKTMKTNDGNFFIRYGGYPVAGSYNAIEVYSVSSLDNNQPVYSFNNIKIEGNDIYIENLKQDSDGRFYGVGYYMIENEGTYYYLIIFNNFIQDGYLRINKYYTASSMNLPNTARVFQNVAKVDGTGIYYILSLGKIIKFEINILEGNTVSLIDIEDNVSADLTIYQPQFNIFKDKLIFTRLWQSADYLKNEVKKGIIDVNDSEVETITLKTIYTLNLNASEFVSGKKNKPFEVVIPYLSNGYINFVRIDLNGNTKIVSNSDRYFANNNNLYAYLEEDYATVTDNSNIYLFYNKNNSLIEFYNGNFSKNFGDTQILKQYNISTLIGISSNGNDQSIVEIKNIYSPDITSTPYYNKDFAIPYYLILYSNSNDNTSLIFSRNAISKVSVGNQIMTTFNVPHFLLNYGSINRVSVYGKTNYLLNTNISNYSKNRFESLYFNFIYNLNVIDNTNGLNELNQNGSNRLANSFWNTFDNINAQLTKARVTYEDLTTEIINLSIAQVTGTSITFSYQISGNVIKIEYLSNDEKTVYATLRKKLTGTNTITQTVRVV